MTRGSVDGLPALTWGRADRAQLATARQLRQLGLRPGGAQPVAVLVFGHRQPGRRPVEYTSLYRISDAAPKRAATAAQRAAIERALAARRTCQECGEEQDYYLPTRSRMCGPCTDATGFWDDHDQEHAAEADTDPDGWWAEREAAMRAEDPHRPVTETDLADADGCSAVNVGAGAESLSADPNGVTDDESGDPTTTVVVDTSESTTRPATAAADEAADAAHPAPVDAEEGVPAAEADPTPESHQTTEAVQRAHEALARLAQRRAEPDPRAVDRARSERLARWHAADEADHRTADRRANQQHCQLEGAAR